MSEIPIGQINNIIPLLYDIKLLLHKTKTNLMFFPTYSNFKCRYFILCLYTDIELHKNISHKYKKQNWSHHKREGEQGGTKRESGRPGPKSLIRTVSSNEREREEKKKKTSRNENKKDKKTEGKKNEPRGQGVVRGRPSWARPRGPNPTTPKRSERAIVAKPGGANAARTVEGRAWGNRPSEARASSERSVAEGGGDEMSRHRRGQRGRRWGNHQSEGTQWWMRRLAQSVGSGLWS